MKEKKSIATEVTEENIFKILESLRKKGLKIYIRGWAANDGNNFIVIEEKFKTFDIVVEDISLYSERILSEYNICSNNTFKKNVSQMY